MFDLPAWSIATKMDQTLRLALGGLCVIAGIAVASAQPVPAMPVQVVSDHGLPLSNAVVMVYPERGAGSRPIAFTWRNAMAQRNRAFVPGTLIVGRGATVAFPNLDTVRHSVYSFSRAARFEIELYGRDQTRSQSFPIAGTVALGCNIHDDMRGYIRVVDTPFAAKTDQNGRVRIEGLPTGGLTIRVWHPQLRARDQEQTFTSAVTAAGTRLTVAIRP